MRANPGTRSQNTPGTPAEALLATQQTESVFEAARSDLPEKDIGWMSQALAGLQDAMTSCGSHSLEIGKSFPCNVSVPEKLEPRESEVRFPNGTKDQLEASICA